MEKTEGVDCKTRLWVWLISIYMFSFWGGLLAMICSANIWYGIDGIQARLMTEGHNVTSVVSTDRNFIKYSRITVVEDGQEKIYLIDANILAVYTFYPLE